MKLTKLLSQHRYDFTALMVCEHCGTEEKLTIGYDDLYYHEQVIPGFYCPACGRNRAGEQRPGEAS